MSRPNKTNGGRPKKLIDWNEAEKLCALQCSELEIADWFHISVDTLARRLKEEKDASFAEFFTIHRVQGKIALRRNMLKMSENHPTMAIFLAKNWLGMSDKQEIDYIDKVGGAENLSDEELTDIIASRRSRGVAKEAEGS